MTGKAGSIFLACLATSQPSILTRPRLMSVTSARYFPSDASSNSKAFSPDEAITISNPPSVRLFFDDALNKLVVLND
jgi:hypothetical protein